MANPTITFTNGAGVQTTETSLTNAIADVNRDTTGGNDSIKISGGNVLETANLPQINLQNGTTLTIDGGGNALDGQGIYAGLFVYSGAVTIQNLTIQNAVAQGVQGPSAASANGSGGGGGGAGLGGGLFVAGSGLPNQATTPQVALIDVGFSNDTAAAAASALAATSSSRRVAS